MQLTNEQLTHLSKLNAAMTSSMFIGNTQEYEKLKGEYDHFLASICKKNGNMIPIYIMSINEELNKNNNNFASAFMSGIMALYLQGPDFLEMYCRENTKYISEFINNLGEVITIVKKIVNEQGKQ